MIWLQMAPVLCLWLAWIFWRRNGWAKSRDTYRKLARGKRIALSLAAAILGPSVLLSGLVLIDRAMGIEGSLSFPAILSILVLGIGFIELQMAALAVTGSLVADNVTAGRRSSSKMKNEKDQP